MDLAILGLVILINTTLAFLVYKNNPKSATNIIFGLLSLFIIGWLITVYISLRPEFLSSSLLWIRIGLVFAVPFTALFLLLSKTFPDKNLKISKGWLQLLLFISIILMVNNASPLAFSRLEILNNSPSPVPGIGLIPFAIFVITSYALSVYFLVRNYIKSTGLEKEQLRFLTVGLLIMLGLIILMIMIPVILFRNTSFLTFAPLYPLIFLGMTAFAIIRHKLFDIRLVVARAVAYALLASSLFIFYVLGTTLAASIFVNVSTTTNQLILFGVLAIIVGYSFQPLRGLFEKFTDKIFYRVGYDSSELLSNLTKIMATTLGLNSLMERLLVKTLPEMRVSKGAFVLIEKGRVAAVKNAGFDKKTEFVGTDILSLLETRKILVMEEENKKSIKKIMQDLDITISIPLHVKEKELGVLLLGNKLSGEIYTDQDIKLLEILSPEISIAIQNSKAYEEIRQFNVKLAGEVEKATSDLRHANDKLKELDKLKDEFMSIASHELRTPMTAIKSYVWLSLHGKTQEKDKKVRAYLDKVFESSERMISMINDMLNVSRIETGRMKLDIIPVSVWKVAEQVKDDLSAKAKESGVEIKIKKETIVPLLMSDKDKLIEIFTNLIGNSLKFTHKGGTVTVSARKAGTMVEVQVTDTGVGIAKENLDKLFKKYGKLNESYATVSPSTGTGLGLYITRQYLEKMGGKIGITSTLGKGTTFTFSLPIAAGKDLQLHAKDEVQPTGIILNPKLAKDPQFQKAVVEAEISRPTKPKS